MIMGELKLYSSEIIKYYYFIALVSLCWILIGALNDNDIRALSDAFRLYIIFSAIYLLLVIYISNRDFYSNILSITSLSAILIAFISFYTVIDVVYNLESIPLVIKDEMYLQVGIHDGYTHLNNINIGMYCFLVPFLLSFVIMDDGKKNTIILFALFLSILAVLLASRRIIVFLIMLVPFLCVIVDLFITTKLNIMLCAKVLKIYLVFFVLLIIILSINYYLDLFDLKGVFNRITDALIYDEGSARQTQFLSLINGFYENPILGSGFGGEASVIRSVERPWNYELTYSKLLFNAGIVGSLLIFSLFSYYVLITFKMCRLNKRYHSINVSLMVGFFSVLIASASNPYLGSFDYLFVFSILPLIINLTKRDMKRGYLGSVLN
ncbi:MAG TPA: hypothetical protein ENK04_09195 [Gammaproteobacteria bacterium]|nr:hypothetical protein [Gammaproteobacteria bacterium]